MKLRFQKASTSRKKKFTETYTLLPRHYIAPAIILGRKECGVRKWAQAYVGVPWKQKEKKKERAHSLRRHYPVQVQRDFLSRYICNELHTYLAPLVPLLITTTSTNIYIRE